MRVKRVPGETHTHRCIIRWNLFCLFVFLSVCLSICLSVSWSGPTLKSRLKPHHQVFFLLPSFFLFPFPLPFPISFPPPPPFPFLLPSSAALQQQLFVSWACNYYFLDWFFPSSLSICFFPSLSICFFPSSLSICFFPSLSICFFPSLSICFFPSSLSICFFPS